MGLQQRRLAEKIKAERLPQFLSDLNAMTLVPIPVTIDWDTFTAFDDYPLNRMPANVFDPLLDAFRHIGQDDLGKEALRDGLTAIHIRNTDKLEEATLTFADQTLTVVVQLAGDMYAAPAASEIIKQVEARL